MIRSGRARWVRLLGVLTVLAAVGGAQHAAEVAAAPADLSQAGPSVPAAVAPTSDGVEPARLVQSIELSPRLHELVLAVGDGSDRGRSAGLLPGHQVLLPFVLFTGGRAGSYACDMSVPTLAVLRERREEILGLARRRGATRVRVFGSVARGEADATSDVDLLVDLEDGRGLFDLGGLLMDLRDALGVEVDVATPTSLRPRVAARVLADAVDL